VTSAADPGLAPTPHANALGPYVGAPPDAHPIRRFARDRRLDRLFRELYAGHGAQQWWPAATPFEVMVGAVLVQNAAWTSAERALAGLRRAGALAPRPLLELPRARLERLLTPAGTFRVKAARLAALCRWYEERGGLARPFAPDLERCRAELTAVHGIGDETADVILCYCLGRPAAIADAYARRILARHGFAAAALPYRGLRAWLEERLLAAPAVHQEFHALCVRAGREHCRRSPRCASCPATAPVPLPR
jgi:endonuclease-3 related protein